MSNGLYAHANRGQSPEIDARLAAEALAPGPLYNPGRHPIPPQTLWRDLLRIIQRYRGKTYVGIRRITAERFIALGFWPIPLKPGTKFPLIEGWKSQLPTPQIWWWADKKNASSAESVAAFWLGEVAEIVEKSQFRDFRRPKSVRLSCHQFYLVVEPLHGP